MDTLLSVSNLTVEFPIKHKKTRVLHGISFDLYKGEILGLVGESGSGKSITASSIMRILPGGKNSIASGSIVFNGEDLTQKSDDDMRKIRGREIAMIFQEPMTSLNPVFTVETQITDVIITHQKMTKKEACEHALKMLKSVHIRDAEGVLKCYPYELSGGMRQRVMIAMALSCKPYLLIADEPTTALDVTVQAQILRLLKEAAEDTGSSVIFITHDLGVISQICDRFAVMYAGEIVECARTQDLLTTPFHPYTKALIDVIPDFSTSVEHLKPIAGSVPDVGEIIEGCRYKTRCPQKMAKCETQNPSLKNITQDHIVACWKAEEDFS